MDYRKIFALENGNALLNTGCIISKYNKIKIEMWMIVLGMNSLWEQ